MPLDPFAPVLRSLPVPVQPFADETAASLASRAALIYARGDATTFLNDLGLSCDALGLGDTETVRSLAIWLGADPDALAQATPEVRSRRHLSLRGHSFCVYPAIPPSPRICPVCLAEDRSRGDRQEYLRTQWTMPAVGACPEHGVLLEPLPRPSRYRSAKDLHLCLSLWPDRRLPDSRPVASHDLDLAVRTFLADGTDRVGGWSLAEALATAPLLGCFVEIGPVRLKELGEDDLQRCTEIGFSLLRDGRCAVEEAVGARIRKRLAEGARSPHDVLGCLNGTFRHFRDAPAFRPLLDAVHGAATRHMRRHWAYSFLNRVIPAFDHATVETLSQSHAVSRESVRFALAADTVPRVGAVSAFGKTYPIYDRTAAECAIARVQDTVSFDAARQMLGMRRFTFEKVWPARVLGRASSWPQRKSRPWRHEVVALRDAFDAAAPRATEDLGPGWVSLSAFARNSRQGAAATARLLLDGALAPAFRCPERHGWEAIRVLETQISCHRKPLARSLRHADGQLTTEALAATYGLRYVTITRLVEMTLLPPADRCKKDDRRTEGYPVAAVEQFFAHYRSLSDLAATHGCSPHLMAPLLARLGVRPLIAEKGHTRLYAIADLPPAIRLAEEVAKAKARNARFKKSRRGALSQE